VKKHPLLTFYVLSLVFSGILLMVLLVAGLSDLFFIATFGPGISGLVTARIVDGKAGLRELLKRIITWRGNVIWWIFLLVFPFMFVLSGVLVATLLGFPMVDFGELQPIYMVIPLIIMMTLLNGITEETGWRGFALPRLQSRYNALVSSLILGFFWGLWHTAVFFVPGTAQEALRLQLGVVPGVALFTVMTTIWSVAFTWVFNHTKGSALIAAVFHGAVNGWIGYFVTDMAYVSKFILSITLVSVVFVTVLVPIVGAKNLSRRYERNTVNFQVKQTGRL
jgi:membrane protease YdiL (CAAX protease family)